MQFLIENSYLTVDNVLLIETVGIPMGIESAPFWASLYLYNYESKYIANLIWRNKLREDDFTVLSNLLKTFVP